MLSSLLSRVKIKHNKKMTTYVALCTLYTLISVTTFTDVIAFFVGSNTLLPGLESFCIYAAVAIFAIFALQVGFYTLLPGLESYCIYAAVAIFAIFALQVGF